jgi:hypothetical protein
MPVFPTQTAAWEWFSEMFRIQDQMDSADAFWLAMNLGLVVEGSGHLRGALTPNPQEPPEPQEAAA